jgi:hypothetical protein
VLRTAYLSMLRHSAGVQQSVPTPVLREELNMTPFEDAWMRRVVHFWNSLASLPTGHLFTRVAQGDRFLGVTTRSPTLAGSVMKTLRDIAYPYPIDAHSLYSIDFAAIKALCVVYLA